MARALSALQHPLLANRGCEAAPVSEAACFTHCWSCCLMSWRRITTFTGTSKQLEVSSAISTDRGTPVHERHLRKSKTCHVTLPDRRKNQRQCGKKGTDPKDGHTLISLFSIHQPFAIVFYHLLTHISDMSEIHLTIQRWSWSSWEALTFPIHSKEDTQPTGGGPRWSPGYGSLVKKGLKQSSSCPAQQQSSGQNQFSLLMSGGSRSRNSSAGTDAGTH